MNHILEYEDFLASLGIIVEASKKDAKVLNKLIDSNLKNSQEMKKVVGQWKKAEGQEKADLTSKLKELTTAKQELEKKIATEVEELDKGIGLEVVDESVNEGKINVSDKMEKKFDALQYQLGRFAQEMAGSKQKYPRWGKALNDISSQIDKVQTNLLKYEKKLGPLQVDESVNEATHEFSGKMLRNMEVGGAGVGPFASTPKVKLKKGQKVKLIIQTGGSMGDNYQFWDPKTGKKLGNKWDHQLPAKITDIVDYE